MSDLTPLEAALTRLHTAPDDDAARLALHAELAAAEVIVWLDGPAAPGRISPQVFDLDGVRAVLAFTDEGRLAGFAGAGADYAALPGRVLVGMLGASGLALLLNADDPAAALLPSEALIWLTQTLSAPAAAPRLGLPMDVTQPDLPAALLARLVGVLERRLSGLPGLEGAVLAGALWPDGSRGQVLALAGVPASGHDALVRAVSEALTLADLGAVVLDVLFPAPQAMAVFQAQGLALSPAPHVVPESPQTPGTRPGMDPARPPRLR